MKLIIAGSRECPSDTFTRINDAISKPFKVTEVVSGSARGVDAYGEDWARSRNIRIKRFPADWSKGKSAGPLRNAQMAEYADCLLAIWDGKSPGTASIIVEMQRLGKPVKIVRFAPGKIIPFPKAVNQ